MVFPKAAAQWDIPIRSGHAFRFLLTFLSTGYSPLPTLFGYILSTGHEAVGEFLYKSLNISWPFFVLFKLIYLAEESDALALKLTDIIIVAQWSYLLDILTPWGTVGPCMLSGCHRNLHQLSSLNRFTYAKFCPHLWALKVATRLQALSLKWASVPFPLLSTLDLPFFRKEASTHEWGRVNRRTHQT